jgi:hypothetical protein
VVFTVDKAISENLNLHGIIVQPGEAMQIVGVQSQEELRGITNKGVAVVDVMELVEDNKETS